MLFRAACLALLTSFAVGLQPAAAASLQVTPVKIQVDAPAAASKISLSNPGDRPLTAQLRVFKWTRINGEDKLVATRDVVASPPVVKLEPGEPYMVRIVRVKKSPVAGEESYRLLVDKIPDADTETPAFGPRFVVRQSIPVFFTAAAASPQIAWDAVAKSGRLYLKARNDGERRLRISALQVAANDRAPVPVGVGLGYVLGQSSELWPAKLPAGALAPGTTITILAQGDNGPIRAKAKIRPAD